MIGWSDTLDALRRGDLAARDRLACLVVGTLQAMRAYTLRESWDDLVQDVLVMLLEHGPASSDDGAVAAYVRRATAHRYVDLLRKEQGRRRSGAAGWRRQVSLDEARELPTEADLDGRLQVDLSRALAALGARHRRVLECKYELGCTDPEGAERCGEALGTYKRLVREALASVRRGLIPDDSDA
jgi:RNA polymerase sigma factor (sigma-70 family)